MNWFYKFDIKAFNTIDSGSIATCCYGYSTYNEPFILFFTDYLYTGLASGSSIEMDKTFNYQATNTALIT
jgi:hypothetical protein